MTRLRFALVIESDHNPAAVAVAAAGALFDGGLEVVSLEHEPEPSANPPLRRPNQMTDAACGTGPRRTRRT